MQELRTIKEQAIDHLSTCEGDELDLTCNITNSSQLRVLMEAEAHKVLGSFYYIRITERMQRLTCGFEARHRQDLVDIAKSAKQMDGDMR